MPPWPSCRTSRYSPSSSGGTQRVTPTIAPRPGTLLDVELAVAAAEAVRGVARRERILDPLAVGDELVLIRAGRQLDGDRVRAAGVRVHEELRVVRLPVV